MAARGTGLRAASLLVGSLLLLRGARLRASAVAGASSLLLVGGALAQPEAEADRVEVAVEEDHHGHEHGHGHGHGDESEGGDETQSHVHHHGDATHAHDPALHHGHPHHHEHRAHFQDGPEEAGFEEAAIDAAGAVSGGSGEEEADGADYLATEPRPHHTDRHGDASEPEADAAIDDHHHEEHGHHDHDHDHDHHDHDHDHDHDHHDHDHHDHDHDHDHHDHDHSDHEHAHGHHGHVHHHHGHAHGHHHHGHAHGHAHGHTHGGADAHRVLRDDEKHVVSAMIVTTLSGLAAAAGGGLVLLLGTPSRWLLGHLLSFACGIMLYISYADLLPHAQAGMATWTEAGGPGADPDGFWGANVAFMAGIAFFAGVVWLVPEPDDEGDGHGHSHGAGHTHAPVAAKTTADSAEEAAPPATASKPRGRARSAGADKRGAAEAAPAAAVPAAGDAPTPASAEQQPAIPPASSRRLGMTGLVAALGISLHNLPEGLIVYNQSVTGLCTGLDEKVAVVDPAALSWPAFLVHRALAVLGVPGGQLGTCFTRGLAVTLAVALHNIPEGMAVATPLYASTGSRWTAFKWCLLSALAEPAAALVFGALFSSYLTPHLVATLNAGVAGIMVCLCLIELVPAACEHVSPKAAVLSNLAGQALMFLSLHAMRATGLH